MWIVLKWWNWFSQANFKINISPSQGLSYRNVNKTPVAQGMTSHIDIFGLREILKIQWNCQQSEEKVIVLHYVILTEGVHTLAEPKL